MGKTAFVSEPLQQLGKHLTKKTVKTLGRSNLDKVGQEFGHELYRSITNKSSINTYKNRANNHPGSFSQNSAGIIQSGRLKEYVDELPDEWRSNFTNYRKRLPPDEQADWDDLIIRAAGGEEEALFSVSQASKALELERTANVRQSRLNKITHQQPIPETKPYQLSEDVEDFMGDTDLETSRTWLKEGGGLEQAADERFLVAGTSRTVTDPSGKKIKLKKGERLTRDMLSESDKEYYDSLMASPWAQSPDDELYWGFKKKVKGKTILGPDELSKMAALEGIDPDWSPQRNKALTFHHLQMKKVAGKVWKRARELYKSGDATLDDLVNLHAMSNQMGQPSGSRKSAGLLAEEAGHNYAHKKVLQPKGIEPTTTPDSTKPLRKTKKGGYQKPSGSPYSDEVWNAAVIAANELGVDLTRFDVDYIQAWSKRAGGIKDLSGAVARWKVLRQNETLYKRLGPDGKSEMTRYLEGVDTMGIADLQRFLKESIEEVAAPMTEEQVLMQEVMDLLTGTELMKLQATKDWDTLGNLRRVLKDKKADILDVRLDEKVRQMGG